MFLHTFLVFSQKNPLSQNETKGIKKPLTQS